MAEAEFRQQSRDHRRFDSPHAAHGRLLPYIAPQPSRPTFADSIHEVYVSQRLFWRVFVSPNTRKCQR